MLWWCDYTFICVWNTMFSLWVHCKVAFLFCLSIIQSWLYPVVEYCFNAIFFTFFMSVNSVIASRCPFTIYIIKKYNAYGMCLQPVNWGWVVILLLWCRNILSILLDTGRGNVTEPVCYIVCFHLINTGLVQILKTICVIYNYILFLYWFNNHNLSFKY